MLCYAKSLQSCPTLCDPIDGSSQGSPVPEILQARTLEWVAISFSNAWKGKVKVKSLSRVRLLATPRTAAYQAPPSMGFSRQEYWSGPHQFSLLFQHTFFFFFLGSPREAPRLTLRTARAAPWPGLPTARRGPGHGARKQWKGAAGHLGGSKFLPPAHFFFLSPSSWVRCGHCQLLAIYIFITHFPIPLSSFIDVLPSLQCLTFLTSLLLPLILISYFYCNKLLQI